MNEDSIQVFCEKWEAGEFPHLRLGQAFYNYFKDHLPHPFPELFYEVNETKAWKIIKNLTSEKEVLY